MSDSPLLLYVNGSYTTAEQQGYKKGLTKLAYSLAGAADMPLLSMMKDSPCAPAMEQTRFVRTFSAATAKLGGIPIGNDPSSYASSNPTRVPITNYIQKARDTFNVPEDIEKIANMGGNAAITSELEDDIAIKGKSLLTGVEYTMFTAQAGQEDQRSDSTTASTAGFVKGLAAVITTNANKVLDRTTMLSTDITLASIMDISEQNIQDAGLLCHRAGSGPTLSFFEPPELQAKLSNVLAGRKNILVNVQQTEMLSMRVEDYELACGIKVSFIPNRTQTTAMAAMLDLSQFTKHIWTPFGVRYEKAGIQNKRGAILYAWTFLWGVEKFSAIFTSGTMLTTNGSGAAV